MLMWYLYGELTMGGSKNGLDIRCGSRASAQPSSRILVEVELSDWIAPDPSAAAESCVALADDPIRAVR